MSGVTLETDGQGHLLHVDQGMISPAECFAGGSEWVAIATGAFMNDEEGVVALAHPAHADRLVACFNACRETPKERCWNPECWRRCSPARSARRCLPSLKSCWPC